MESILTTIAATTGVLILILIFLSGCFALYCLVSSEYREHKWRKEREQEKQEAKLMGGK